jgi:hypothetical protein
MSQFIFGSGAMYATPLVDATGNAVTVPTPVKFLACQDISIDLSFDTKMLYGQNQFPLAVARGKGKATVKAKHGQVNGALFNNAFFGQTLATGQEGYVQDLTGTAIPSTPFTITPAPPSSGVWAADMGVRNASGIPMTRVASAPATGQYSVSAGLYTFAAADTGLVVYIDYRYTMTTGKKIAIGNQLLGSTPLVALDIVVPYGGKMLTMRFPQAISGKMGLATKLDDFTIPEVDFDVFADSTNNVGTITLAE